MLPLLAGLAGFLRMVPPIPEQSTFTYYGDVQNVASGMIPRIYNHSYSISAELEIPQGGAEGVIVAEADHLGGFAELGATLPAEMDGRDENGFDRHCDHLIVRDGATGGVVGTFRLMSPKTQSPPLHLRLHAAPSKMVGLR